MVFFNILLPLIATGSSKILDLYILNDDELLVVTLPVFPASVTGDSSLLNCYKLQMYLNNYHYIQSNCK